MASHTPPPVEAPGSKFVDFDDQSIFETTKREAAAESAKNFVVEFGAHHARIARDLEETDIKALLTTQRGAEYPIRWINIWDTSDQKELVKVIGEKYNFSHRLRSLMMFATELKTAARLSTEKRAASKNMLQAQPDVEKGDSSEASEKKSLEAGTGLRLEGEEVELYFLVKDTVHYTSIDQTEHALCIGAHWLHRRPEQPAETVSNLMPPKHWLWLAICNDNTVLSFHEEATVEPAPKNVDPAEWKQAHVASMRSNTLNVLLQQSSLGFRMFEQKPLSQASVRRALEHLLPGRPPPFRAPSDLTFTETGGRERSIGEEGTSNLFYYLFEDYAAAGPLKAAGRILDEMTPKVLNSANRRSKTKSSEIIPKLHNLSKELRKLKHLFENYKIVIEKIMSTTKLDPAKHHGRRSIGTRTNTNISDIPEGDDGSSAEVDRVVLTRSAMYRFERLRDRLQGLMLNTIQGHFEEITALSDTYFNLTQQKDSQATARLTRSATLLAKLSVFFLPISFMTSYFSVQITDLYIHWSAKTYWYSFSVIASVSFFSLFFFSRLLMFFSDVLDEWAANILGAFRGFGRRLGIRMAVGEDEDDEF